MKQLSNEEIKKIISNYPENLRKPSVYEAEWRTVKTYKAYEILKQYEKSPLYYRTRDELIMYRNVYNATYGGKLGLLKEYLKLIVYFIFRR